MRERETRDRQVGAACAHKDIVVQKEKKGLSPGSAIPALSFFALLESLFPADCFQVADADRCARKQAPERGDGGGGRSVPALISAQVWGEVAA